MAGITKYSSWVVQIAPNKSKMADSHHLEKSQYLRNGWTNFDEIWHDNAPQPFKSPRPIKFRDFQCHGGVRHHENRKKTDILKRCPSPFILFKENRE